MIFSLDAGIALACISRLRIAANTTAKRNGALKRVRHFSISLSITGKYREITTVRSLPDSHPRQSFREGVGGFKLSRNDRFAFLINKPVFPSAGDLGQSL